jgi:hypothetical protein
MVTKYNVYFGDIFSVTIFFPKVKRKMDFGHFKNVHFGKSEKSLENDPLKTDL